MYIGPVFIPNPLVLAPMAGVTDLAFRRTDRKSTRLNSSHTS